MYIVKGWAKFQHYKQRCPPWIKLHKSLLDDYKYHCLPDASRALAPCLWLLASESHNGEIPMTAREIGFRLRMDESKVAEALKPLIANGFIECDSAMLATCKQDAMLETETETEAEKEIESETDLSLASQADGSRSKPKTFKTWNRDDLLASVMLANEDNLLTAGEIQDFADYWMEQSATGRTKLAMEKTWDTRRRMQTAVRAVYERQRKSMAYGKYQKPEPEMWQSTIPSE